MTAREHPNPADRVTLTGDEAAIYEAIATLEFVGHPPTATDIATAVNRDVAAVLAALDTLTERGLLTRTREAQDSAEAVYEPAWRGWSTAPDQRTGPQL